MKTTGARRKVAGILLGIGIGGFIDGIVFHQILQWHHMVSSVDRYPPGTLDGLQSNTIGDGLFHAGALVTTIAGVVLLWKSRMESKESFDLLSLAALLLMGIGLFNIVEGLIDHHILRIHHVRDDVANPAAWDIGFLIVNAIILLAGVVLFRHVQIRTPIRKMTVPRPQ